jgi:hypothetical protein
MRRRTGLAAALALTVCPAGAGAVGWINATGYYANNGFSTSDDVPLFFTAFSPGQTAIMHFAFDPVDGPVACTDPKGNVFTADHDTGSDGGTRIVVFSSRIAVPLTTSDKLHVTFPSAGVRVYVVNQFDAVVGAPRFTGTGSGGTSSQLSVSASGPAGSGSDLVMIAYADQGPTSDPDPGAPLLFNESLRYGPSSGGSGVVTLISGYQTFPSSNTLSSSLMLPTPRPWAASLVVYDAVFHDAGTHDAGTPDAGTPDAGTLDAGTLDAGTLDAGTLDAGSPAPSDGGVPVASGSYVARCGCGVEGSAGGSLLVLILLARSLAGRRSTPVRRAPLI